MGEAAPFPCEGCGAPLAIELGQREVSCASCGQQQVLPEQVDRTLRRHLNEVDATLELAEIERQKLDAVVDDKSGVTSFGCLATMCTIGGMIGIGYYLTHGDSNRALWSVGITVVGFVAIGVFEALRRRSSNRQPPPPAGAVACGACGGFTPIVATDHAVNCGFCGTEVIVSEKARKRALEVAERELAFARAQALAMKDDDKR